MRCCFIAALACLALAACDAGSVQILEPTGATSSSLGALALSVVVDSTDAAAATTLGWSAGVPDATVKYTRVDQDRFNWVKATTDSTGHLLLAELPPGQYWVTAERDVTGPVTASLPYGIGSPRAFGGGEQFQVTERDTVHGVVPVELDRAGSVVLSEVYTTDAFPYGDNGGYWQYKYIELYNNSGIIVYLDNLIIGRGYLYFRDYSFYGHHSCLETQSFRTGSHVWSVLLWQLPGSGEQYPLAPGKTAVLAVSAIDHRTVLGTLPDLRDARFEFAPPGSANNPSVPDIRFLGPWFGDPTESNYFNEASGGEAWFVARPLDVSILPVQRDPYFTGPAYLGIPVSDILDYVAIFANPTDSFEPGRGTDPYCNPTEPRAVDHLIAEIMAPDGNGDLITSGQRRILRYVGGRAVLMDTNTSPVDWVNLPRTPGSLPGGGG